MFNKIRQLLHRKDQFIYNYNYEIEKFDTTFGFSIKYKNSWKRTIERLIKGSIYFLISLFIFNTRPFDLFGFSPLFVLFSLIIIIIIILFIIGIIKLVFFYPTPQIILEELVRQKKLNKISEEKFNDYIKNINEAIENSNASEKEKKEAIDYNNDFIKEIENSITFK
jgi:hypothetical protein